MNAFADSLFAGLFGWLRALLQSIWGAIAGGGLSGFFTWLGDNWLWLVIFLGIAATIVDFCIWLIRWRPYKVWATRYRHIRNFFKYGRKNDQRAFEKGYQDSLALDIAPADEYAPYPPTEEYRYEEWQQPIQDEPAADSYTPADYYSAWEAEPLPQEGPQFIPATEHTEYPGRAADDAPKRPSWRRKFSLTREEDEGMLDSLPPAIDRQEAFHQPVYPHESHNPYAAWQRPVNQQQGTDHHA
ncbi:MAG: hypothetical protein E7324_04010 [Clostridiales bacterium]|nr:hypothetical protein [Clostridiales bacterium]